MKGLIYLIDDITIDMLEEDVTIVIEKISVDEVKRILGEKSYINAIRDENVLKVASEILDIDLTKRDERIKLKRNDEVIIIRKNGEMYRIKIK